MWSGFLLLCNSVFKQNQFLRKKKFNTRGGAKKKEVINKNHGNALKLHLVKRISLF